MKPKPFTHEEIAAAFNEWLRRYDANPGEFQNPGGADHGEDCARYLAQLIAEARAK